MNKPNDKPVPNEPLSGSGPDRVTPEMPVCPTKKVPCNYWTDDGCQVDVCWMDAEGEAEK